MQSNLYRGYIKCIFDSILSAIGILILLPFFLIIATLIKINSPGPIFYKQIRIGKNFKPFKLLKFRSMIINADQKGLLITQKQDSRITSIGKVLRKTKCDELPQLWNVLIGDMSLVGPRPEVEKYVLQFKNSFKTILSVKPGITDLATLHFSDEEHVLNNFKDVEKAYIEKILPEKLKLSEKYVQNISLFLDINIIFKTLFKIIR